MIKKKKVVKSISPEELKKLRGGMEEVRLPDGVLPEEVLPEDTFFTIIAPAAGPAADGNVLPTIV